MSITVRERQDIRSTIYFLYIKIFQFRDVSFSVCLDVCTSAFVLVNLAKASCMIMR